MFLGAKCLTLPTKITIASDFSFYNLFRDLKEGIRFNIFPFKEKKSMTEVQKLVFSSEKAP